MMKPQKNILSILILAGGHSSRMGYPKPWLLKEENLTFLEDIITTFKVFGVEDVVVVINKKFTEKKWEKYLLKISKKATIITNLTPGNGRLYSIQLGLQEVKNDQVFIHNVDNPFIELAVLEKLSRNMELNGVTIPSFKNKGGHPIIITKVVKDEIANNYKNHETLKSIFSLFPKKYVEVNTDAILKNINTPKDFQEEFHEFV